MIIVYCNSLSIWSCKLFSPAKCIVFFLKPFYISKYFICVYRNWHIILDFDPLTKSTCVQYIRIITYLICDNRLCILVHFINCTLKSVIIALDLWLYISTILWYVIIFLKAVNAVLNTFYKAVWIYCRSINSLHNCKSIILIILRCCRIHRHDLHFITHTVKLFYCCVKFCFVKRNYRITCYIIRIK